MMPGSDQNESPARIGRHWTVWRPIAERPHTQTGPADCCDQEYVSHHLVSRMIVINTR
jgi:hypothetical protein